MKGFRIYLRARIISVYTARQLLTAFELNKLSSTVGIGQGEPMVIPQRTTGTSVSVGYSHRNDSTTSSNVQCDFQRETQDIDSSFHNWMVVGNCPVWLGCLVDSRSVCARY